jgi:hypothetical protein
MSDNKNIADARDRSKVDANDKSEVEYVHSQFPYLKHQQVVEAIQKKGPDREAIYAYLKTL